MHAWPFGMRKRVLTASKNFWSLHFPFSFSAGFFVFRQCLWLWLRLRPNKYGERPWLDFECRSGPHNRHTLNASRSTHECAHAHVFRSQSLWRAAISKKQYVFAFGRFAFFFLLLSFRRTGWLLVCVGAHRRSVFRVPLRVLRSQKQKFPKFSSDLHRPIVRSSDQFAPFVRRLFRE